MMLKRADYSFIMIVETLNFNGILAGFFPHVFNARSRGSVNLTMVNVFFSRGNERIS